MNPIAQVMVKQMLFMDAPAHTRLRTLASTAFSPARVAVLRSHIQEIVDSLIDAIEPRGRMDVIADFAYPLPAIVTAEMLGVPVSDRDQLKAWSADFAEMLGNFQHNPDRIPRVLRSVEEMTAYFQARMAEIARASPPGADPFVDDRGSGRRAAYRRRGGRQLHRHHGGRPGDHHESDRQRTADAAAQSRTRCNGCGTILR